VGVGAGVPVAMRRWSMCVWEQACAWWRRRWSACGVTVIAGGWEWVGGSGREEAPRGSRIGEARRTDLHGRRVARLARSIGWTIGSK
jgi:hypothetical protein